MTQRLLHGLALGSPVLLAALHPLVFMLRSHSVSHQFALPVILRPAAVMVGAAIVVWLLLRACTASSRAASVSATFFFVAYGAFSFLFPEGDYRWFITAGFTLASLGAGLGLARLLDRMAGVVVSWVVAAVVAWTAAATFATNVAMWPEPVWWDQVNRMIVRSSSVRLPASGERPDIYYIVLDGMVRLDVLERLYGVDSREAVAALESMGVEIPRRSRSNYTQTQLSMASSLNMQYLDELAPLMNDRRDKRPVMRLISESGGVTALRRHGYDVVVVKSGTSVGEERDDRWGFSDLPDGPTELETALFLRLPISHPLVHRAALRTHRRRVLHGLDLIEGAASERPMLLIAHIVSPHPPFVMAPDGGERLGQGHFTFSDGDGFPGSRAEYIAGYAAQAAYVLARVVRLVERIVARSPRAIVVIHSDHGSGLGLVNKDASRTDAAERLAIFSAYYSGGRGATVPETMSPVNALRWVLRTAFGARVPLLPDRSYLSDYDRPYRFTEIPPQVEETARPAVE